MNQTPRAFGFAGYSGAGKTTLITALIPHFVARGLRVALIKHTHHDFDLDHPGKDSYRHRAAGAQEVMLVCSQRWALLRELRQTPEPSFAEQVARMSACDLVLVEGYKEIPIPKMEVLRRENTKPALWPHNDNIVAVATDAPQVLVNTIQRPVFALDDYDGIVNFVLHTVKWTQ